MSHVTPRNPLLGALRLAALGWTLLSLLGIGIGVLVVILAAAWGCIGHAQGWLACTAPTLLIPLAMAGSLFTAVVVLLFVHLFYVGGAKVTTVETKRPSIRGQVIDVITDILD